jgi:GNAT superfamily N-acetyltransferase
VSSDGDIAMLHAIEVSPRHRRQGVARAIIARAAAWAAGQGCGWLGLAVTTANEPARALYTALGMAEVGTYHYRILAPEAAA